MSKKCSAAQRFIRTEMTTYRIGTLVTVRQKLDMLLENNVIQKLKLLKMFFTNVLLNRKKCERFG